MIVFPAPAGINREFHRYSGRSVGVPRASGDKPPSLAAFWVAVLCSPRQRG